MNIEKGFQFLYKGKPAIFTVTNVSEHSIFYKWVDEYGENIWSMLKETFNEFLKNGTLVAIKVEVNE